MKKSPPEKERIIQSLRLALEPKTSSNYCKKLIRFLKESGFELYRTKGSHQHFVHPSTKRFVTVPVHSGQIIGPGLLKAILKQAGVEWED